MSLTPGLIQKIAHLARLNINEADVPQYTESLSNILKLVDEINQVNTANIIPMAHPFENITQRLREDAVTEQVDRQTMQSIAPEVEAGLYLVPQVIGS